MLIVSHMDNGQPNLNNSNNKEYDAFLNCKILCIEKILNNRFLIFGTK